MNSMKSDADHQPPCKRQKINPLMLFQYSFFIPLLADSLDDKDVLTALLLVDHDIRFQLKGYCLKRNVKQSDLSKVASLDRILPVKIISIYDVTSLPIVVPSDLNNSSVKVITFDTEFNQPITRGSIPSQATDLRFGYQFNQPILVGCFPPSLERLFLGFKFNQHIPVGSIPASVTHLTFSSCFNQPVQVGAIPDSVTHLQFGDDFNQPLPIGSIPSSVTHLTFGCNFSQSDSSVFIPLSVTHLTYFDMNGNETEKSRCPLDRSNCCEYGMWCSGKDNM